MQVMIIGLLNLATACFPASCRDSPPAWSTDGRWLAYTVVDMSPGTAAPAGWLFAPDRHGELFAPQSAAEKEILRPPSTRFRIWATERAATRSVLIDESPWPLSAPGWEPGGHRLAYMRLVPQAGAFDAPTTAGRWELVVQDALDRKRVVLSSSWPDLTSDQLGRFSTLQPVWSTDGRHLLLPRPGSEPAILIVDLDRKRIRKTILGAIAASWSPEGNRLALVVPSPNNPSEHRLQVLGNDFTTIRLLKRFGEISGTPAWMTDGQSILLAARRLLPQPRLRGPDLGNPGAVTPRVDRMVQLRARGPDLIRVQVDSELAMQVLSLAPAGAGVRTQQAGTTLVIGESSAESSRLVVDFDRDRVECVFAADLPGQEPVIGYCGVQQPQTHKRFAAIDLSLGIGSIAMHPDGQLIAVRVDGRDGSGPAFLCRLDTEEVTLLAPDPSTRREWLATLASAAARLLESATSGPVGNGRPEKRLSLLPIAGELPPTSPLALRLKRLGKVGRTLWRADSPTDLAEGRPVDSGSEPDEYRVLFEYLYGDFATAESVIAEMEAKSSDPDSRLHLLAARAQVLHAEGRADLSLPIVEYLLRVQRPRRQAVEESPQGLTLTTIDDPVRAWLIHLSGRMARPLVLTADPSSSAEADEEQEIDLRIPAELLGPGGNRLNQFLPGGLPRLRIGPGQRPRFDGAPGRLPADPFNPERFGPGFAPMPPRPFQPLLPFPPGAPRPEQPNLRR